MITIPYLRYTYIHTSLRYTYIHTSLAQVLIFFLFILLRQWDMALFWLIFLLICCPAWSSSHQSDHNQHSCSLTQKEGGALPSSLSLSLSRFILQAPPPHKLLLILSFVIHSRSGGFSSGY